jgi:RNA polymerase sigma factor (sigma-70 family)
MPSDADLVARIKAGDDRAFDELFRAYWGPLCTFVAFIMKDDDDARELVADLFAGLWERRAQWNVVGSLESYLFVAARNRTRSIRRDVKRRTDLISRQVSGSKTEMAAEAHAADLRLTLEHDIDALPERYQTALYLRWRRDLEYEDIARVLETTPDAAKKVVQRAMALLRQRLKGDPRR